MTNRYISSLSVGRIQGRDVIAQSQSGTGKTAVFSISALQMVDERSKDSQVLILSPTRELADQSCKVVNALGDFMSVSVHACVGGKSLGEDLKKLEQGVQIVSGTPGRVYDLIRRQSLPTKNLKALIIDEADEMLDKVREIGSSVRRKGGGIARRLVSYFCFLRFTRFTNRLVSSRLISLR